MKINFKERKTIALLIASVAMIFILVGALLMLTRTSNLEVPDFTTLSAEDAENWRIENKLDEEQVIIIEEFNEDIEEGKLISQTLDGGSTLGKKDILTLIFSQGHDPDRVIELPDFIGKTEEEIQKWFDENKFTDVSFEYVPNDSIKEGVFIESNITTPTAKRSDVILISISVGKESIGIEVTTPDFSTYTRANISAWAKTNNITVTFTSAISSTVEKGKVIKQSPQAGDTILTGGKLKITLSLGKGITVSDLKGKTKTEIDKWAKDNNLKVVYKEYYSNTVVKNKAISSSPTGTLSEGSTVTVKLSIGKPTVSNYTEKSLAQFQAHIQNINANANGSAKLTIKVVEQESTKTPGTILSQIINGKTVTGSTEVNTGTEITVNVAKEKKVSVVSKANSTVADFKSYIEGLGLVLGSKTERYSTSINSGLIISNDTGLKSLGASINYVVSLGAYNPTASSFDGKTKAEIDNIINSANQKGANWSININYAYNNTIQKGISYGCSISGTQLNCNISNGSYITVVDKAGTTESAFLSYISSLGLNAAKRKTLYSDTIAAGSIIWNLTGSNFTEGNVVEYDLSLGKEPMLTVPNYSLQLLSSGSYEASVANVQSTFAGFTNLTFVPVASDDAGQPDGLVLSISVAPGEVIPPDTAITVQIIQK